MIDLYTYMYEWNELYEQLEALVHVQVNIDVNFIFLIIKKPFLLSLGHKMIGIRNIRVDYERELLLTSISLLYSLFYNSCVLLIEFYYIHEKEYHCHFLNYEFKGWV